MNHQSLDANSESGIEKISEITEFYDGCNVLLTGASGFVGKLLIDKLLRSCTKIQKLYIILRGKKGKSPDERYKELFDDLVYDRLKREQPNFQSKVFMIEGELDNNGLNLSAKDRELIKDSHIVFHGAATVRFDDKLRFAVNINVRGTKEILLLCRQMPNLKAIVHIGTAFSQCISQFIDEVFYEPPIDCDRMLNLLDLLNDEQLETLTPTLVGKFPNTYAFTKSIAEDVVLKYHKELPVVIVRPSIMIPTEKEPVSGWINNIYGPTGVLVGAAIGLLHSLHCNSNNVADIIPADYVINNIIAAAWDIGTTWQSKSLKALPAPQKNEEKKVEYKPPIYNTVTSVQNPVTWGDYMKYNEIYGLAVPSIQSVWYYFFTLNQYLWIHNAYVLAFDMIPAVIVDTLARLTGRKPMLLATYKKIHKFSGVISYFCTQQWKFRNDNVLKLWGKMSPVDQKIFYFHVGGFKWSEYFYHHVRGLRVYLVHDSMSTLEKSRKKHYKLKVLHYTVATLLSLFLLWLVYALLSTLFSFIVY
ncbi:hypothetical protein PV328_000617 [Microctonus aethiopoides]|uniref:Fatty acyl-CoA reductase n=1 Tax=Microctonus aethiopoides TaxID=144406 RepID=A0AA39KWT9_9HYME|nr:hypothetical protein PV328_000617 [Microctonus aethiopoides]